MAVSGGGKKPDPGKKQLKQVLAVYDKAKAQQGLDLAIAGNQGREGVGSIKKGYADAKRNVAGIGLAAKTDILKQGKQTQAAVQSNEVSRGFGGSNIAANKSRQASLDTGDQLAKLDETIGQFLAGLDVSGGNAVGGAQMSLSQLLNAQSGQKTDLAAQIAQAIAGVQHGDPNAWMSSAAQLGTAALIASDERLKRRFSLVGEVEGIPIWEFEYRTRLARHLPGRYRGVRAQEVAHIPGAVHELPDGTLIVDYSMLPEGAQFRKVA